MKDLISKITPVELVHTVTITGSSLEFTKEFFTDDVSSVMLGENDFLHCRQNGTFIRTIFYEPNTWILMANRPISTKPDQSFEVL